MYKKTKKIKKVPRKIYNEVFSRNFTPLKLCSDQYPWFVKSIPPKKLYSVYISGSEEPEQSSPNMTTTPGETLIGGMDVYRNAPEDPKKYNKDWYAIFKDPMNKTILLFRGPIKDNEHWIDTIPERLNNAEPYYVPAKTDKNILKLGGFMLSDGNDLLKQQIKFWRESLKPTINQALELTPEDKLDWAPAEKMISLGKVFMHISECSDWWYDEVMKGKKATELAFADKPCPSKEKLKEYLELHWERLERFFADSPEVLSKTYPIEHEGKTHHLEGYWIFNHQFEHDIHHRSQINQYLRILGIVPPKI